MEKQPLRIFLIVRFISFILFQYFLCNVVRNVGDATHDDS